VKTGGSRKRLHALQVHSLRIEQIRTDETPQAKHRAGSFPGAACSLTVQTNTPRDEFCGIIWHAPKRLPSRFDPAQRPYLLEIP